MPIYVTLDAVQAVTDPTERAAAAVAYLGRLHEKERQAITVRDAALREARTPAPVLAATVGVSVATVKAARRSSNAVS